MYAPRKGRLTSFKFGVRVHQKSATVSRLRFAIAFPSREYDPENMLFACKSPLRASKF